VAEKKEERDDTKIKRGGKTTGYWLLGRGGDDRSARMEKKKEKAEKLVSFRSEIHTRPGKKKRGGGTGKFKERRL